jgi:hypothetical protein
MLFNTIIYLRFKLYESRVWLVPSARGVSCRYVLALPSTYELIRSASSPPFLMWPAARRNIHNLPRILEDTSAVWRANTAENPFQDAADKSFSFDRLPRG